MSTPVLFGNDEFELQLIPSDGDTFIVVASGVARHLAFRDATAMLRAVPEDEKGYTLVCTPGGDQRVSFLTEPGLYRVLGQRQAARITDERLRSMVDRFQRFLFHDLLPAFRRGEITMADRKPAIPPNYAAALREAADQYERAALAEAKVAELKTTYQIVPVEKFVREAAAALASLSSYHVGERVRIGRHRATAVPAVIVGQVDEDWWFVADTSGGTPREVDFGEMWHAPLTGPTPFPSRRDDDRPWWCGMSLTLACTCDPGPNGEHYDYCETNHPNHPCDVRSCRWALPSLVAAVEWVASASPEALREVLREIVEQHEPDPDWVPPCGTCTGCGGTGIVYHGTGEDGHIWGPETCCCDHNHCVKCHTCCGPDTGDLRCPELILILGGQP